MGELKIRSWREVLKELCASPEGKREVSEKVGFVSFKTLERWIDEQTNPQKHSIKRLASLSDEMHHSLQAAFPDAFFDPIKQTPGTSSKITVEAAFPSEFYRRVARAYAHVPPSSRRWTIWHLLSNQMLPHLDPHGVGLVLFYLRPGQDQETVQIIEGAGTALWITRQCVSTPKNALTDRWLVQAVTQASPLFIQSCRLSQLFPPASLLHREKVESMAFFPLHRSGKAIGGFFLCAAEEDFFSPLRKELIEQYACLMAMAYDD